MIEKRMPIDPSEREYLRSEISEFRTIINLQDERIARLEAENATLRERLAAYEKIMEESKIDTQGFDQETLAEIRHTDRPPMSEGSAGE